MNCCNEYRRSATCAQRSHGCNSQAGIALVELSLVFVLLILLVVGFALSWLPEFSNRTNKLVNALASLGACLVDPVNIYRLEGGQLIVRDDLDAVVQAVLSNCSRMAGGAPACAYVFDQTGTQVYAAGLNETTDRECGRLNVLDCLGRTSGPFGLTVALLPENGPATCDWSYANDPGAASMGGEGGTGSGGGSALSCPGGYFQVSCQDTAPAVSRQICCRDGMQSPPMGSMLCQGCPTGFHLCNGDTCVSNADPNYPDSCPLGGSGASPPPGVGTCTDFDVVCDSIGRPGKDCCPLIPECQEALGCCAYYAFHGNAGCRPADGSGGGSGSNVMGCPLNPPPVALPYGTTPGGCDFTVLFSAEQSCNSADGKELIRTPPAGQC